MSDHLLQNAWRLHQAGNFAEAARMYNDILRLDPRNVGALQLLGYLHFQRGDLTSAERVLSQAVKINPRSPEAHYNLGCAFQAAGRQPEALAAFEKVLALDPNSIGALFGRANTLSQLNRFEDALASYDRVLALGPATPDAVLNRGNALYELHRYAEALASYDKALALRPGDPTAWSNRGNALMELKRGDEALACFDRALSLDANHFEALENRANAFLTLERYPEALTDFDRLRHLDPQYEGALYPRGRVLQALKRNREALDAFDQLLRRSPKHVEALIARGIALIALDRDDEAVAAFEGALKIDSRNPAALSNCSYALLRKTQPEEALVMADRALAADASRADAWHNRGAALAALKDHAEALAAYERALAIDPENSVTWGNRGTALVALRRSEEALPNFARALALDQENIDALSSRANAYSNLKRLTEAIADCERAIALDPDHAHALAVLVHCRLHCCDWRNQEDERAKVRRGLDLGKRAVFPLDNKAISDSEEEHLVCTRIWVRDECSPAPHPLWRGESYRHDKIRLAYLSTDLRAHAVAFLIVGAFEHHDKERFETTAISFGPDDQSETRARIVAAFDRFIDARKMSDVEVANFLKHQEIDIAIDLNGHTGDSRPRVLSYRPAPVQVNFLGYPGTMGSDFMDYVLADQIVVPETNARHYAEKIVYLPDVYQPNDFSRRVADGIPSRAAVGLPDTGFVFCSFNNTYKIRPPVFAVWMRLLRRVEGSVLWLLEDNATAVSNLKRSAEAHGVSPGRLVFAPRTKPPEHLARQKLADVFLDTLPYNAHTTASDALWIGLPLVTCIGDGFAGRVAASILHAAGLPELVTTSLTDYEALALKLALDPEALAATKAKVMRNRETSALFDIRRFTRGLEYAYTEMWQRRQKGLAPESFSVPAL
jgi:predicted O-linked N-acetylglucosamine transferase (SPINDLY family)